MVIDKMKVGKWGKIRAFFDLKTNDQFTIKGFKIVEGEKGLFVSFPSQKGNDDEWYDTVWCMDHTRKDLTDIALSEYRKASEEYDEDLMVNDALSSSKEELPF